MKKLLFIVLMIMTLIMCNKVYAYKEYEIGDEITYRDELYYVIENSNKDENYITLLKDIPLTINELYKYGKDKDDNLFINQYAPNLEDPEKVVSEYSDNIGGIAFYTSEECGYNYEWNVSNYISKDFNLNGCNNSYKLSDVKKVIENWSFDFEQDLVSVNGYKSRIPRYNEIKDNLGYVYKILTGSVIHEEEMKYDWIYSNKYKYWTMSTYDDSNIFLISIPYSQYSIDKIKYDSLPKNAVRPVINLNKCVLNDDDKKCNSKEQLNSMYNSYNIGDDVIYNNELYHVIKDSDENSNYITLLKDKPLTVDELKIYGKDNSGNMFINKYFKNDSGDIFEYEDGSGGISYFTRIYCGDKYYLPDSTTLNPDDEYYEISYCTTDYDASNINKVINKWAFNIDKDLVKVNGYKVSLIDNLKLDYVLSYEWGKNDNYSYWTRVDLNKTHVYSISKDGKRNDSIFNKNAVRPVINLNKCAVEKNNPNCNNDILVKSCSTEKVNHYKEYQAGDEITYHGSKYHVMENSSTSKNYVTLFKDDSLTLNDLPNYKDNILNNMKLSNNAGYTQFLCDGTPCADYDKSNIKNIIENWTKFNFNDDDLASVDGYKARIISKEDLIDNLGYYEEDQYGQIVYSKSSWTPDIFPNISFWTMFTIEDSYIKYLTKDEVRTSWQLEEYNTIVPVVNIKKDAISSNNYSLGEQVTYKNDIYYIISKGNDDKDYVTLLKSEPFNLGELTLYQSDKNIFSIPYYISDTCNSGSNLSGCSSNFDKSEVKKIIDMWTQSFNDDLVEVEGYKARIPSKYDFIYNFYYDMDNVYATSYVYCSSNDTPKWVNIGYPYWSMEVFEDSNSLVYQNMKNGCLEIYNMLYPQHYSTTYQSSSIRPVINVNKCAIGGCYETEECINDEKPSTTETIVEVAKTLKNIPKIILIICSVLVISGSAFIIYNYFKSKKERK